MPATNPPLPIFGFASAVPASTEQYSAGSVLMNSDPRAGASTGWQCTVTGRPGTWVSLGVASQNAFTPVTAASSFAAGTNLLRVTNTAAATYTLAPAASFAAGFAITIVNTGGGASTFAAGTGNTIGGGSVAITAANTFLRLMSDGGTNWYNVS